MEIKNICCIGAGYVGGPTMAVIAAKCPNINVNVVDKNLDRLNKWNNEDLTQLPIYEKGLEKLIAKCRGKNLDLLNDLANHIAEADMIFISVNTPSKKRGIGAAKARELKNSGIDIIA